MNEEYLKGLHNHLGINDDYDTWVGSIKDNNEYKINMHKNLNIKDDFNTWDQSIFGVKKKVNSEVTNVSVPDVGENQKTSSINSQSSPSPSPSVGNVTTGTIPEEPTSIYDMNKPVSFDYEFGNIDGTTDFTLTDNNRTLFDGVTPNPNFGESVNWFRPNPQPGTMFNGVDIFNTNSLSSKINQDFNIINGTIEDVKLQFFDFFTEPYDRDWET